MNARSDEARRARAALRFRARHGLVAVAAVLLASGCTAGHVARSPVGERATAFTLGADVSALATPGRRRPLPAFHENGAHGWNSYRLRVFVPPVRNAPDNSLERMIPLARQIKASGALLLLDLHYSDTWADPGHQETPVAWRGLDFDGLERQFFVS